jgi:hypothetical protein
MVTTKTKKKAAKSGKAKSKPKADKPGVDLGTATGIREARQQPARSVTVRGNDDDDRPDLGEIMHEQREEDALEAKLGAAAKLIKAGHGYVKETDLHYRVARSATATTAVIQLSLERVVVLGQDIIESAKASIEALGR